MALPRLHRNYRIQKTTAIFRVYRFSIVHGRNGRDSADAGKSLFASAQVQKAIADVGPSAIYALFIEESFHPRKERLIQVLFKRNAELFAVYPFTKFDVCVLNYCERMTFVAFPHFQYSSCRERISNVNSCYVKRATEEVDSPAIILDAAKTRISERDSDNTGA